jgi:hypothetical protein
MHLCGVAQGSKRRAQSLLGCRAQRRVFANDFSESADFEKHRGHCVEIAARHLFIVRSDDDVPEPSRRERAAYVFGVGEAERALIRD